MKTIFTLTLLFCFFLASSCKKENSAGEEFDKTGTVLEYPMLQPIAGVEVTMIDCKEYSSIIGDCVSEAVQRTEVTSVEGTFKHNAQTYRLELEKNGFLSFENFSGKNLNGEYTAYLALQTEIKINVLNESGASNLNYFCIQRDSTVFNVVNNYPHLVNFSKNIPSQSAGSFITSHIEVIANKVCDLQWNYNLNGILRDSSIKIICPADQEITFVLRY